MTQVIEVKSDLVEFKKQDAVIADMAEKYSGMTVAKHSYKAVRAARIEVKNARCAVENLRVDLKKQPLELCKTIDAEAKRLTKLLEPIESALEKEEKAEDARKEAAAKAIHEAELAKQRAIEEAKAAALQARFEKLKDAGVFITDARMLQGMTDADFELFLEDEAARASTAKAEADEIAKLQREELEKQAEELRLRQLEMEEDKRHEEARLAKEREAIEAERAEMRRQQEELAKHQAELRAKAEAEAAELRRKEREAEETRRAAMLAPELEKLNAVLKAMTEAGALKLDELCEPAWGFDLVDQFVLFAKMMNERVREFVR
jgi:transcription-repair coupling factor (superfamily II helicase)